MPTPSDTGTALPLDEPRRLHPLSWLFVLLQQLRAYAIPLVVLLVTGRGSTSEWYGLIGVAVLTGISVAQYFSYRFEPTGDGIVVRSGILQRTSRDIPYERIHTVNLHQTLLHRLFDVTEVRLESAGSKEPEAVMRVLALADARALEELVQARGGGQRRGADAASSLEPADRAAPLFALDAAEIVRLGLISNRGMVVVATVAGLGWQLMFESQGRIARDTIPAPVLAFYQSTRALIAARLDDTAALVAGALVAVTAALVLVRALSVLLALLQYHGFTLHEHDRQLRLQRGLLTRVRHQLPRRRIQAWRIDETLLHRWFGRQTLRVDSAAGADDERGIRELAPVASPSTVTTLLHHLLPDTEWPSIAWRPVDPRAWRRLLVRPALLLLLAVGGAVWLSDARALALLAGLPLLILRARRLAAFAGYAIDERTVSVRSGWLTRRWGLVSVAKLQSIRVTQSPFDRRFDMATLWLDTAGASAADGVLRIRFLPCAEARRLYTDLSGRMATPRPIPAAPVAPSGQHD